MRALTLTSLFLTIPLSAAEPKSLFDGKTLTGWEGDEKTWRVEDGAIVGGSLDAVVPRNEFLCTTKTYGDFELKLKFKLLGDKDKANAGVQFRSKRIPKHHEVIGYQADIGKGYWGALYDESRRNKVLAGPKADEVEKLVKADDWNDYTIRAQGPWIQLWLNGTKTVNYIEKGEKIDAAGIIGLQVHGGAKSKVLYKDITLEELLPLRETPKE
jgi:3-keto-disaccharide hydrolase